MTCKVSQLIIITFLTFSVPISNAEEQKNASPPSELETMQKIGQFETAMEKADELKRLVDSMSRQKYSECLMAFGNTKFCSCLRDNSPVGINFSGYIQVVTTSKETLGYSKARKEDQKLIDATLKAREICVAIGK
jgi:hypothetical protein